MTSERVARVLTRLSPESRARLRAAFADLRSALESPSEDAPSAR